jgi:hypothetical protein
LCLGIISVRAPKREVKLPNERISLPLLAKRGEGRGEEFPGKGAKHSVFRSSMEFCVKLLIFTFDRTL